MVIIGAENEAAALSKNKEDTIELIPKPHPSKYHKGKGSDNGTSESEGSDILYDNSTV